MRMAKTATQTSPAKLTAKPKVSEADPVDAFLADNPDVAEELAHLTRSEKIIRLRQRGLIDFDVQE